MKFKNYCTQRKICLPSDTMLRGNEADCFITSLVAPGLPIAPLKYTLMKFKIYSAMENLCPYRQNHQQKKHTTASQLCLLQV